VPNHWRIGISALSPILLKNYPEALLEAVLCNANGVGIMSCMQAVVLSGAQPMQNQVLEIAAKYPRCTPSSAGPIT
jgi:hypothetical protein